MQQHSLLKYEQKEQGKKLLDQIETKLDDGPIPEIELKKSKIKKTFNIIKIKNKNKKGKKKIDDKPRV